MPAISVENLRYTVQPHFWSRPRALLSEVSFSVDSGEVFGFLGPNGAGKTTTIKALLGLIKPQAGKLQVHGLPPGDAHARRRLGYMPERAYFPEELTGRELVVQHALLAGLDWAAARSHATQVLDRVGLGTAARTRLSSYSKGMLQRVGLAQALVGDPDLLILDEPMSGLDPMGRRDVREIMLDLRRAKKTVLFSTHIIPDVELICDQVAILVRGSIRRIARLNEVLGESQGGVELLTGPLASPVQSAIAPLVRAQHEHTGGMSLEVAGEAQANQVIDLLRQHGVPMRGMQRLHSALEDMFVHAAREAA